MLPGAGASSKSLPTSAVDVILERQAGEIMALQQQQGQTEDRMNRIELEAVRQGQQAADQIQAAQAVIQAQARYIMCEPMSHTCSICVLSVCNMSVSMPWITLKWHEDHDACPQDVRLECADEFSFTLLRDLMYSILTQELD
jgi:hypothetical protein